MKAQRDYPHSAVLTPSSSQNPSADEAEVPGTADAAKAAGGADGGDEVAVAGVDDDGEAEVAEAPVGAAGAPMTLVEAVEERKGLPAVVGVVGAAAVAAVEDGEVEHCVFLVVVAYTVEVGSHTEGVGIHLVLSAGALARAEGEAAEQWVVLDDRRLVAESSIEDSAGQDRKPDAGTNNTPLRTQISQCWNMTHMGRSSVTRHTHS